MIKIYNHAYTSIFSAVAAKVKEELKTFELLVNNYLTSASTTIIAEWGEDNDYPDVLDEKIKLSGLIEMALMRLGEYTYGAGLVAYKEVPTADGKMQKQMISLSDPMFDGFFTTTFIEAYLKQTITDYWRYGNAFPMLRKGGNGKIVMLKHQQAKFARWEKQDPKNMQINYCYISANWANGLRIPGDGVIPKNAIPYVNKIPALDIYDAVRQLESSKETDFIYPIFDFTSGNSYYHDRPFHAVVKNGWVDIIIAVPKIKKALFDRAMRPDYEICIAEEYWHAVYGKKGWTAFTAEEQQAKKDEKMKDIDTNLMGQDNFYKSLLTGKYYDPYLKLWIKTIDITPLEKPKLDGEFLSDSQQGNSEVLFSLGIDSSLIGVNEPGGKIGAGSGSDKRTALDLLQASLKMHRDVICRPLQIIAQYNGWGEDIKFGLADIVLTTLDVNPTGSQKSAN